MFKDIIYIEKSISKTQSVKNIIDKIRPKHIVYIDHYKEVLNQTNSNWKFNKSFQKLILAKKSSEFYYKGSPLTSALGYKHFYYTTLALNCLYHCEYCYLQGMYNTPHLVLFLNNKDYIQGIKNLLHQLKEKIYLALSYDTDLPALEQYYPYCKEWISFANKEENLVIEIRTKSYQVNFLENFCPTENVIISFTLSPDDIQKIYEPNTPHLNQRLKAVKYAINKEFKTMLCFDPLLYVPNFKQIYSLFFEKLFSEIDTSKIYAISIGTFRMNADFFKRIRKSDNLSDIYYFKYEIRNKTIHYPINLKNEMISFIKHELTRRNIQNIFIYE